MKILYLAHRIPYPPDKGDKIRSYHTLAYLAERHDVWCACFVDDPTDMQHVETLRRICREVVAIPLNRTIAKLRSLLDLAIDETATEGFYRNRAMIDALRQLSRRVAFDCVFVYSSSMGQYARLADAQRRIIDLCDLDSRKWAQIAGYRRPPASWLYRAEADRLERLEHRLYREFDATIVIGPHEARDWSGPDRNKLRFVANGVNLPPLPASPQSDASLVGFVGDMAYFPNQDAVTWFVRQVWPAIRSVVPAARFEIVGRHPSRAVQRLECVEGVHVVGAVPNVTEYLHRFGVVVAPLRIARGIQNKVLESMAAGRPVVATRAAAEGIQAMDGESILLADDAEQLAAQVNRVLRDPMLGAALGQRARALVGEHFSWKRQLAPLDAILSGQSVKTLRSRLPVTQHELVANR